MVEVVSKVYADALFTACLDSNELDAVKSDYDILTQSFKENSSIIEILSSPLISRSEKGEIISKLELEGLLKNFINVLLDKKRINLYFDIKSEFDSIYNEFKGIINCEVQTVVKLSESQKNELIANLEKSTGKSIVIHEVINESLIGGMLIRIGDNIIDGSIRKSLGEIQEEMLKAIVH